MYWVDSGYDCWRPHPLANWVTIVSTALCDVSVISKGPACQYTFDGIVQESAAQRVYLLSMHSSRWRWWCVYQIICGCEKLNCKIRLAPRSAVLHILGKVEQFEVSLNTEHPASSILLLITARGWRPSGACVRPSSPSSGGCSPAASATLKPSQKSTCQYCACYWFHVSHFWCTSRVTKSLRKVTNVHV